MTLTVALAGSRHPLREDRRAFVWNAFLDAMYAFRTRLSELPPYRFIHTGLSWIDQLLADRLTALGREVSGPLPEQRPAEGAGTWQLEEQLVDHCDALVVIWDVGGQETLYTLNLAWQRHRPFELRVLSPPSRHAQPVPWLSISSDRITSIDQLPQPRRPMLGEELRSKWTDPPRPPRG